MSFIIAASGCRIPCSLDGLSGLECTCGFRSVFPVPSLFFAELYDGCFLGESYS